MIVLYIYIYHTVRIISYKCGLNKKCVSVKKYSYQY